MVRYHIATKGLGKQLTAVQAGGNVSAMKITQGKRRWIGAVVGIVIMQQLAAVRGAEVPKVMTLGPGWAANSVNTAVFRTDSITSSADRQYAAWYDASGHVVIATRA